MKTLITTLGLAVLSLMMQAAQAGDPPLSDSFSAAGDWASKSNSKFKVAVENGVLTTTSQDGGTGEFTQPVRINPAARWRAAVDITFRSYNEKDAAKRAGLAVNGPLGDGMHILLTSSGYARISYWDGKKWVENDPLPFADAKRAKTKLNETNRLSIERESGFFRVYVNDDYVGRTRVMDFTPTSVGVVQSSQSAMTVEFDNLVLDELGMDTRFMRLLNISVIPGSKPLVIDDFTRGEKQAKRIPAWESSCVDVSKAITNGRFVALCNDKESSALVTADSSHAGYNSEGGFSDFQVGARFNREQGDGIYGLELRAKRHDKVPDETPVLNLLLGSKSFVVYYFPPGAELVRLVDWTKSPSIKSTDNHLNLTWENGRLLIFINGDFQTAVDAPKEFYLSKVGFYAASGTTISVDDFYAGEM
ncbi:MAG: hypothetical protein KKG03_02175 [Gammaproteobacteria bacterium]|nr:hypothetical protein [Sideroxydans sp.]MBU3903029.1 hypothetical protein [Gammaproteobacteria bacterium]MBU4150436.1 hypothetical protein [Gammaproteobacteria bacterium]